MFGTTDKSMVVSKCEEKRKVDPVMTPVWSVFFSETAEKVRDVGVTKCDCPSSLSSPDVMRV